MELKTNAFYFVCSPPGVPLAKLLMSQGRRKHHPQLEPLGKSAAFSYLQRKTLNGESVDGINRGEKVNPMIILQKFMRVFITANGSRAFRATVLVFVKSLLSLLVETASRQLVQVHIKVSGRSGCLGKENPAGIEMSANLLTDCLIEQRCDVSGATTLRRPDLGATVLSIKP